MDPTEDIRPKLEAEWGMSKRGRRAQKEGDAKGRNVREGSPARREQRTKGWSFKPECAETKRDALSPWLGPRA